MSEEQRDIRLLSIIAVVLILSLRIIRQLVTQIQEANLGVFQVQLMRELWLHIKLMRLPIYPILNYMSQVQYLADEFQIMN